MREVRITFGVLGIVLLIVNIYALIALDMKLLSFIANVIIALYLSSFLLRRITFKKLVSMGNIKILLGILGIVGLTVNIIGLINYDMKLVSFIPNVIVALYLGSFCFRTSET